VVFLGAVGGLALAHLPGLSLVPAIAMGMGATAAAMLQLPLTSVLLATLVMGADGLAVMPVVIVAVAVSYVASVRLASRPAPVPPAPAPPGPADGAPLPTPRAPVAGSGAQVIQHSHRRRGGP
jgi:hypothetical protein